MGTFTLSAEEYGQIRSTVLNDINGNHPDGYSHNYFPLLDSDQCSWERCHKKTMSEASFRERCLDQWLHRCYVANQLAEQYADWTGEETELTIRVGTTFPDQAPLSPLDIDRLLEALVFNVETGVGDSFLSKEDYERLDRMKSAVANRFMYESRVAKDC